MWRVIPGQDLRHRTWDDEHVVYNNLTGDTHLLSADAMQLLLALQAGPLDQAGLVAQLAAPDDDLAHIAGAVEVLLEELAQLSLIDHPAC